MHEYEKVFRGEELQAVKAELFPMMDAAQVSWSEQVKAERARLKRGRKKNGGVTEPPQQWFDALRQAILLQFPRLERLREQFQTLTEERERTLNTLAGLVELTALPVDAMARVDTSSTCTYRTQTQPDVYARGRLVPYWSGLQKRGIPAEIRVTHQQYGSDFELWAAIAEWQYDAFRRALTLDEAVKALKAAGCNPRVYFPFLPERYW